MLYKVLGENGESFHGGSGVWSLPKNGHPGEWMPEIKGIKMCRRGYHACREGDLVLWLGPAIYEAERDEAAEYEECDTQGASKIVSGRMRLLRRLDTWNERTQRLYACDCADAAMAATGTTDPRSVEAVSVARRFAVGEATAGELERAAWAARAAAWAAAWDAAKAAARDAACDAAWDAAKAGARAAACDAAKAAAKAAACDAARAAAWSAAKAAAKAAAWDAAWAAWAAAWADQTINLFAYLRGEK